MGKTANEFVKQYNGKAIDYDHAFGVQCVDGFRAFCQWAFGTSWPTGNGWADGYWYNRAKYSKYFIPVSPRDIHEGDWVIWARGSKSHPSSHIAMYHNGMEFGQNQGGNRAFCLKYTNFADCLGALRWVAWKDYKPTVVSKPSRSAVKSNTNLKVAGGYNKGFNRTYRTTANVNIREGHSTACRSLGVLKKGTAFRCYGFYDGNWLYGVSRVGNRIYTGFIYKDYLR